MGFILTQEEATELIRRDSHNKDVLFPYLNGDDLNSRPDCGSSRWVINFFDWPLRRKKRGEADRPEDSLECAPEDYEGPVAEDYPACTKILIDRVRPQRDALVAKSNQIHEYGFWRFWDKRPELYRTISSMERVMVTAKVSKLVSFSFVPRRTVFHDKIIVLTFQSYSAFCVLSSSLHDYWVWKYSTKLGISTISYVISKCFETFPFPDCIRPGHPIDELEESHRAVLEDAGKVYYEERAELMRLLNLGLTKTHNHFHDPALDEARLAVVVAKSGGTGSAADMYARIMRLRELHAEMDRLVLRAYGWPDIDPEHVFHELDFIPENDRTRFTISEKARRVVLERLLDLNFKRHAEEEGKKK